MVAASTTALFWVTLPVIPVAMASGTHTDAVLLTIKGSSTASLSTPLSSPNQQQQQQQQQQTFPVSITVRNFTLPDAAHSSQWTEADPFGNLETCNVLAVAQRPPHCITNHTNWPHDEQPCLTTATVDTTYEEMYNHRINRVAWMYVQTYTTNNAPHSWSTITLECARMRTEMD